MTTLSLCRHYKSCRKEMGRNAWRGNLEATSENRHGGCGRDTFGQTVPITSNSNREGPIG